MPKIVVYLSALIFFIFFHPPVSAEDKVMLNEVLVKPETGQKEWVELYNSGTDSVDLGSYWIDDDESLIVDGSVQTGSADPGSDPKQLSGQILPGQFLIFEFSSYFNDDGDSVAFFNNQGIKIDSYTYDDNPGVNVTFGRKPDGTGSWLVSCNPTPNQANDCPIPSPTPSPTPSSASLTSQSTSSTKSPTPTPKPSPTPAKSSQSSPLPTSNSVLGTKTEEQILQTSSPEASPMQSAKDEGSQSSSKTKIAAMFAGSGIILIGLSVAFFVLYNRVLNKSADEEKKEN